MVRPRRAPGRESGYIALIAVLVVGAAATAIAITLLTTGVDSQRAALIIQQGRQARALAIACGQEAAQQVHDNIAYKGTGNITQGQGSCTYLVANTTSVIRTINATGTVGNTVKKVQATATIGATTVTIGSWKDVSINTPPTPAFVQIKMNSTVSSVASLGATFNSAQTAGDTNVVIIGWDSAAGTISSVADTASNTYVLAAPLTRTAALSQAIYYAKNIAGGGPPNVTVTFSASTVGPDLRMMEYSGLDTTAPFDASVSGVGLNNPSSSGIVNTSFPTDLIVSGGTTANAYTTAGAGYTLRGISTNGNIAMDGVVTTIGPYTATAPGSGAWVHQAAAFRAAGQ
ncbi:MAG TPA: hypothetical protein VGO07_01520 [Candidatus Saccharimonadales bacterium]|jgi:hypothetical protein|nr:hypothetical protein [Candidatus Saccharimonadales bacterium]